MISTPLHTKNSSISFLFIFFIFVFLFLFLFFSPSGLSKSKKKGKSPVLSLTKKDVIRLMYPKNLDDSLPLSIPLSKVEESEREDELFFDENDGGDKNKNKNKNKNQFYNVKEGGRLGEQTEIIEKEDVEKNKIYCLKNVRQLARTVPQGQGPIDLILEMTFHNLSDQVCHCPIFQLFLFRNF